MAAARALLGAGPQARRCVVDGVELAVRDEGAGAALVCLHSIGHGARDFASIFDALCGRYRVVALDWPGHGDSGADPRPPDARRYAALLRGALDKLGIERAVLLGNSIGGAAALELASAQPARIRGLVLVDSGGLVPVGFAVRTLTSAMSRFFAAGARGARWFPRAFAIYYGLVLPRREARAQRDRIVAACRELAGSLADAWRSFGRPEADLRAKARALTAPVLVCWARADLVIPLRLARPAIDRIPDCELATFPGGHAPFLECPEQFLPALERFLARLPTD